MGLYTYSPNDGFANVGGFDIDFNKVTIKQVDDTVKFKRGVRGETVANVSRARQLVTLTMMVPASSKANVYLNQLHDAALIVGSPALPGAFTNINGGMGCVIPQGYLTKKPGPEHSDEASDNEWVFEGPGVINQAGMVI